MSYVAHKSKAFDAVDAGGLLRKRSEGRLKRYPSATDARAWCIDIDDRRQHILDLIKADHEISLGRYVPVRVLINALLANKTADLLRLQAKMEDLEKLLSIYERMELTKEQRAWLNAQKRLLGLAAESLSTLSGATSHLSEKSSGKCSKLSDETSTTTSTKMGPCMTKPKRVKENNAELLIQKDAEIIALKNALAAQQADCEQQIKVARAAVEQLETLKAILDERDYFKKQLQHSLHELQTLKSRSEDPCAAEIAALEAEIERLRTADHLSPEEETEIIRKEVDVLKKYCAKLSKIQQENQNLKQQLDRFNELSKIPAGGIDEITLATDDPDELKGILRDLSNRMANYNELADERDRLKVRVKQLEDELRKYGDLPKEIEIFRQRSEMLDDVLDERNSLQRRLDVVRDIESELVELKKKADRVDELERQLAFLNDEVGDVRRASAAEVEYAKSRAAKAANEAERLRNERDELREKSSGSAVVSEQDFERMKNKAKESEILKLERDKLRMECDRMCSVQEEVKQAVTKCRCLEEKLAEKEGYKAKYEELLALQCECKYLRDEVDKYKEIDDNRGELLRQVRECECHIAEQEDEIQRLVCHIDQLSQGSSEHQDRVNRAICTMRRELDQKDAILATSEEHLASVQHELKATITEVSSETGRFKSRIDELEIELEAARSKINQLQDDMRNMHDGLDEKNDRIRLLSADAASLQSYCDCKDLEVENLQGRRPSGGCGARRSTAMQAGVPAPATTITKDEHLDTAFRQSKCAVERITGQIESDDWQGKYLREKATSDDLRARIRDLELQLGGENAALRRVSGEVQDVAKNQIAELIEQLKKANERISMLEMQLAALQNAGVDSSTLTTPVISMESGTEPKPVGLQESGTDAKPAMGIESGTDAKPVPQQTTVGTDCDELRKQLEAALLENQNLKEALASVPTIDEAELLRDKQEKEDLQNLIKMLQAQLEGLEAGNAACSEELEALKARLAQLESENADLTEKLAGCDPDYLESLKNQLADLQTKIGECEAERQQLLEEAEVSRLALKSKQESDIRSLSNKFNDGIAKLQGSHEEILREVSHEHEQEVESLRLELRKSMEKPPSKSRETLTDKPSLTSKTVSSEIKPSPHESKGTLTASVTSEKSTEPEPEPEGICTCGPAFQAVAYKLLANGIESLGIHELELLHTKTCEAAALYQQRHPGTVPHYCGSPTIDKLSLLKRITALENELIRKQKVAQKRVAALQIAVKMERDRLESLRNNLDSEKAKNSELVCKIGAQSRAVASMQVEKEMLRQQSSFHEEQVQDLMSRCKDENTKVRKLEDDLFKARQKHRRDSDALEAMRVKLEKSLNNELMLKMQIEQRSFLHHHHPPVCPGASCQQRTSGIAHSSKTETFHTDLSIQDIKNKRNFVHECALKQRQKVTQAHSSCVRCRQKEDGGCSSSITRSASENTDTTDG